MAPYVRYVRPTGVWVCPAVHEPYSQLWVNSTGEATPALSKDFGTTREVADTG